MKEQPLRTLHLLKTSVGASWALRQMRELVGMGMDVHAVMPLDGPLVRQYRDVGVTVHEGQYSIPMRTPRRWPELFRSFRELVDQARPDVIHSHFVGTTLTMRLALGKNHPVPRVFQVPGPLHLEHAAFRRAEIATAGPSDFWIGSCEWTCRRYVRSGVDSRRVHLAYYGLELDHLRPQPPGALRKELNLPDDVPLVGMVAYMYAPKRFLGQRRGIKGHEDLIDAMVRLREKRPEIVTVLVGGAWDNAYRYEQTIRAYAKEHLGHSVHLLGTRRDIPFVYADFDVAVHPSHSENLGGAAESLLLNIPTVATNVGGFPDIVVPGETGWLVPPRNPDALAAAIADALEYPVRAREMAKKGRLLTESLLDIRATSKDVFSIYKDILNDELILA